MKGLSTRITTGKNTQCKLFWIGNETESNGNTIFIAKKWIEKVLEVKRARDRLIMISLLTNKKTVVQLIHLSKALITTKKDRFYKIIIQLNATINRKCKKSGWMWRYS